MINLNHILHSFYYSTTKGKYLIILFTYSFVFLVSIHHKQVTKDRWHKIIPSETTNFRNNSHVLMQDDKLKVPNLSSSSTQNKITTRTRDAQTYKS